MKYRFVIFCTLLFTIFITSCEGTYSDIYYYGDIEITEIDIEAITE